MNQWTQQTIVGVVGGGLVFVAIFVPAVALQFRRYGRVSVPRLLGAAGISVYAVSLLAYTLLPLPDVRIACASGGIPAQLQPLAFVSDIAKDLREHGTSALLTGKATMQVLLNVVLFVPLGIIARRFWSFGVVSSSLIGLVASFAIEATQYTGDWGLYPCAYRVADVDDLLANTAGAVLGALVAPAVLWWMPSSRDLRSHRLVARPVSVWRRWLGMVFDLAAFGTVAVVIGGAGAAVRLVVGGGVPSSPIENVVAAAAAGLIVVVLPALVGSGASIGQRLVWLRPVMAEGMRPSAARRLVRAATTAGAYAVSVLLGSIVFDDVATAGAAGLVEFVLTLWVLAAVVCVPFTRGYRGLSGVLSGTEMIDARTSVAGASNRMPATSPREHSVP